MYAGQDENSNFWLPILNGLKKHGVEDILVVCGEGLIEFDQVIDEYSVASEPLNPLQRAIHSE